jgi:hypothetical protein
LGAEEAEEAEEEEESINPCPCRSARSDGHRVSPIAHHSSFMDKTRISFVEAEKK